MSDQGIVFSPKAATSSGRVAPAHRGSEETPARVAAAAAFQHERVRSVTEVTFGLPGPSASAVQPGDNRRRVRDTIPYPTRSIAYLRVTIAGVVYGATGWFAGPRTVITAGHVVYTHDLANPARHGWVGGIEVIPGYDAGSRPYNSANAIQYSASQEWVSSANTGFDYGAIFLAERLGDTVGLLGFASHNDVNLRHSPVSVTGYPVDNPDPVESDGALWTGSAAVSDVDATFVRYPITTTRGQSGSPVLLTNAAEPTAVAIHAYGSDGSNVGTRINDQVFQHIEQWRKL